jgi:hypothetical protein
MCSCADHLSGRSLSPRRATSNSSARSSTIDGFNSRAFMMALYAGIRAPR